MQEYITLASVLSGIRLLYEDCGIRSIVVEGHRDCKLIKHFFGKMNVKVKQLGGWENVVALVCEANKGDNNYILGIIDSDYHRISTKTGHKVNSTESIVYTDQHDIEMMLFLSPSFDKYLDYWASDEKMKRFADHRRVILSQAAWVGALRLYSVEHSQHLVFADIEYMKFIDKGSCTIDCARLVEYVLARTRCKGQVVHETASDICDSINHIIELYSEQLDLYNGHDVLNITAIAMQSQFATLQASEATEDKVFGMLFMGFEEKDFAQTNLHQEVMRWLEH